MNTFETLFTKNLRALASMNTKRKAVKLLMAAGSVTATAHGLSHVWVSHGFTDFILTCAHSFVSTVQAWIISSEKVGFKQDRVAEDDNKRYFRGWNQGPRSMTQRHPAGRQKAVCAFVP